MFYQSWYYPCQQLCYYCINNTAYPSVVNTEMYGSCCGASMYGEGMPAVIEKRIEIPFVNIKYPEVRGLEDALSQNKINALIRDKINELVKEATSAWENIEEIDIQGGYEVTAHKQGILSINFLHYTSRGKSDHGINLQKSLTVNTQSGQNYQFKDLFQKNKPYNAVINTILQDKLIKMKISQIPNFEGIKEKESFYLTEDALVMYFPFNGYTTCSQATTDISIPFALISNIIDHQGPVGTLLMYGHNIE